MKLFLETESMVERGVYVYDVTLTLKFPLCELVSYLFGKYHVDIVLIVESFLFTTGS